MADSAWISSVETGVPAHSVADAAPRHAALIRVTHWLTSLCFLGLLITGIEIVISHPRFYWGDDGNALMEPLFKLPIPASRGSVPTGYGFVLPDQNGWSRSLHFQSAWIVVFTGFIYLAYSFLTGGFRRMSTSYNRLQRLTYLAVVFLLFPLMIWTGLAMSPAVVSAFPAAMSVFGGQQSARTLHFFDTLLLVLFVIVHVFMVWRTGFTNNMRAMITGESNGSK